MAKAIEQTPTLEDKEAVRFLDIISNVDTTSLKTHEKEVKEMVHKLSPSLKL